MAINDILKSTKGNNTWTFTAEVYEEICRTIGCRKPEQGGLLGSSDGKHIDYYYFDSNAQRTASSYTMNAPVLNKVIADWNDNGIRLVGIIHSHPFGITRPSHGDMMIAKEIIETMDVEGRFFTPIVQVSPKLNGEIKIHPYTFEQCVELKSQQIEIEKKPRLTEEDMMRKRLSDAAPNRFARIKGILPPHIMSKKKVICIGCGGSRSYLEMLARCGVGNFVLIDGDKVEDTNIATQGAFISEIGRLKTDVLKNRILDINPLANVTCINRYLDNQISDEEFVFMTGLNSTAPRDTIICGCTDSFIAQDRCAQLSVKYGIPYLAAQIFEKGIAHEVLFSYPGLTASCPRCMLESRYQHFFTNTEKQDTPASAGSAVCVTDHLNSIKEYMTLYILCYKEEETPYAHMLDKYADRNYIMTRCADEFSAPAFEPIVTVSERERDLSFPFVTIAIEQTPEKNCPLCGGNGTIASPKLHIYDTRITPKPNITKVS